ncbi:expressed unknown protein [Seminavis robusta]|uniref:PDZ domain-containing protein n=1 Tax=Seminavis robusta TaxID=568900 RepID=A0A9N8DCA1_9STRA|nr:expressed unknown protein [Seminavis robusta]|eukprot:Sro27_g017990.1 n/a (807) ;mRNA; r:3605-6117
MKRLCLLLFAVISGAATANDVPPSNHLHEEDRTLLSNIINYADKIQNAVPTVPTTPMPTTSPTFSSAPTPSPSATPTQAPTVSAHPSIGPTIAPTVSAQPTNVPTVSSAPSTPPSIWPSSLPSTEPSGAPSNVPSVSAIPSSSPTPAPSSMPSSSPTKVPSSHPSSVPSDVPSSVPTLSMSPTLMYRATLHTTISIPLQGIDAQMNVNHTKVFESVVRYFIQQNLQDVEGAVLVSTVTVQTQQVLDVGGKELVVDVRVLAIYESLDHPDTFDFKTIVADGFEVNFALFKSDLLDTNDPFFLPLDPARVPTDENDQDSSISQGTYIAVAVCSIIVSLCGVAAAYYSLKKYQEETDKGDKLSSDMYMYTDPVDSQLTQDDVGCGLQNAKSIEIIQVSDSPEKRHDYSVAGEDDEQDDDDDEPENENEKPETPRKKEKKSESPLEVETLQGHNSKDGGSYTELLHTLPSKGNQNNLPPKSPNTMEAGTRLGVLAESILRSESFGSNRDPPTEANRFKYSQQQQKISTKDPAAKYRTATFGLPRPDQRDDFNPRGGGSAHARRDPSVVGANQFVSADALNSFFPPAKQDPDQRSTHSRNIFELAENRASAAPGPYSQTQSNSAHLRQQQQQYRSVDWPSEHSRGNGALNAAAGRNNFGATSKGPPRTFENNRNEPTSPASSAVSSSINAFLNMVGGTLGAAPLASPAVQQEKKEEKNEKFHDILQREGLYDVFAPAGALGIVVDTTKDGPAVHSLKQTSPMLGLINPGDLIVGLDAQDTRSMTAATLTRLMASKSNQKERKITLLAADTY